MPVFLDRIVNRVLAVVISVTLILAFGEVIPQALCTGPNQVKIAAFLAPLTRVLMIISWPLSFWIGKALDVILGEHHKTRYLNTDLKALVELHTSEALKKLAEEEEQHKYIPKEDIARPSEKMGLTDLESNLMLGALGMRDKKTRELVIPFDKVFMISYEEKIDQAKIQLLLEKGYSRIPVYANNNKNDIIGVLRIKSLITYDVNKNQSLKDIKAKLRQPLVVHPDIKVSDLFKEFLKGKSHMAFITEQVDKLQAKLGLNRNNSIITNFNKLNLPKGDLGIRIIGIVTLEDILEYIFKMEIFDEDDYEKSKTGRAISGVRSKSILQTMLSNREVRDNFVNEKEKEIRNLIKENSLKKKNEKEEFLELNSSPKGGLDEKFI